MPTSVEKVPNTSKRRAKMFSSTSASRACRARLGPEDSFSSSMLITPPTPSMTVAWLACLGMIAASAAGMPAVTILVFAIGFSCPTKNSARVAFST